MIVLTAVSLAAAPAAAWIAPAWIGLRAELRAAPLVAIRPVEQGAGGGGRGGYLGLRVHWAGGRKGDDQAARNLVRAAKRAGARHLVFISVIGADRIPVTSRIDRAMFGYFAFKLGAEQAVADSGVPWTTLRAAQFHDLILMVTRQMAKLPVIPVPAGSRFQPVDTGEVADRLVELALGAPAGLVPDMGGPRIYRMADLLRSYLRARGAHRPMVPVRLPGRAARAVRAGANLAPERAVGHLTWEDFLTDRLKAERSEG